MNRSVLSFHASGMAAMVRPPAAVTGRFRRYHHGERPTPRSKDAMTQGLRPAYYIPAAVLLVVTSAVVTLLFAAYADAATPQRALAWITGISAAGLSATVASLGYMLNRQVAFRSATIEAQKMLLEINKQYVQNPKLLHIEGEPLDPSADAAFMAQLRAMVYLKLNVFEVIFAVLPSGVERDTWINYFRASLDKSSLLSDELERNRGIYHPALMAAYDAWTKPAGR
jgi:hypothetical protein